MGYPEICINWNDCTNPEPVRVMKQNTVNFSFAEFYFILHYLRKIQRERVLIILRIYVHVVNYCIPLYKYNLAPQDFFIYNKIRRHLTLSPLYFTQKMYKQIEFGKRKIHSILIYFSFLCQKSINHAFKPILRQYTFCTSEIFDIQI